MGEKRWISRRQRETAKQRFKHSTSSNPARVITTVIPGAGGLFTSTCNKSELDLQIRKRPPASSLANLAFRALISLNRSLVVLVPVLTFSRGHSCVFSLFPLLNKNTPTNIQKAKFDDAHSHRQLQTVGRQLSSLRCVFTIYLV